TLTEFIDFAVPPSLDSEAYKPLPQTSLRLGTGHTFQAGEIDRLFADFHFFVKSAFFGQITQLENIRRLEFAAIKQYPSAIGRGDAVNDPNKRSFSGAVRAK